MILVPAGSREARGAAEDGGTTEGGGADEAPDGNGVLLWIVGLADVGLGERAEPDVDGALQATTSRLSGRTRRHMRQVCGQMSPETLTGQ
jgi:hypothetical protein